MTKIKDSKVITLLLVLILTAGLMACGKSNTPEDAVNNYFDAIGKGDLKSASEYAELSVYNEEKSEKAQDDVFTKAYFKKISCKVKESKEDGDKATVKTEVSAPDIGTAYGAIMEEYRPKLVAALLAGEDTTELGKEIGKSIEEMFSEESKVKIVKTELDINLIKKDGSWIISEDNMELGNAIKGNLAESLNLQ